MKFSKLTALAGLIMILATGMAHGAAGEVYRQQSDASKMMHKLGRGITNILTCWVELPRNVAIEWEKTDPVTGLILGSVKGVGWTFTRLVTGAYDTLTFPFPVPANYEPMLDPEFVVTDVWGDPIPSLTEFGSNDPDYPTSAPIYPERFNF
jgi:putative exosortase-associated protein (TIGR04073 family)